jgi:hypothetical protein
MIRVGNGSIYDDLILGRIGAQDTVIVYDHISDADFNGVVAKLPYKDNIIKASIPSCAVGLVCRSDAPLTEPVKEELLKWGNNIITKMRIIKRDTRIPLRNEAKSKLKV